MDFRYVAASKLPAETLDLLFIYKVVLFCVISRCLAVNRFIFSCQDKSLLHHLFLLADSQLCFQPLIYTLICLFFLLWIIGSDGYIYYNRELCFLEAISRGVVSSCWWMLANRRCQTQCSRSFIISLKDVPPGILTSSLPAAPLFKKVFSNITAALGWLHIRWWRERTRQSSSNYLV